MIARTCVSFSRQLFSFFIVVGAVYTD